MFVASIVHAGFGFGTALVAMPPLVVVLGIETATPLVGLAALTTIVIVLTRERRSIDFVAARQLLLASLAGIPCGLLLLEFAPTGAVKGVLGSVLIAYSLYQLKRPALPQIRSMPLAYACGFTAGVLGGAYNTNSPPVVLYGALARWPAKQFRATLQGFFLPMAVVICLAHAATGLWTRDVFSLYGALLPALLFGNWLGVSLGARLDLALFSRGLYVLLAVFGVLLFF